MLKKVIAESFLKEASAGNIESAFEKYIHKDFKHHLIYFKGDRESFKQAMIDNCKEFPQKTYETIHLMEENDLVTIHGRVKLNEKIYGVIHIFRFKDDKIIESWEASQENIENSLNENGLF